MKHQLNFIATILCIATSNAMELTCLPKIRKAHYLTDNCVIISSDSGCFFVNPITNSITKQIGYGQNPRITVRQDRTTFALWDAHRVHVYDYKTEQKIWWAKSKQPIHTILLPPLDDAVLTHFTNDNFSFITRDAYNNNPSDIFLHRAGSSNTLTIAFNPVHQQVAVSSQWCWPNPNAPIPLLPIVISNLENSPFCEYSPDGSLLALGITHPNNNASHCVSIVEVDTTTNSYIQQNIENTRSTIHIKFHPNSCVLATLSTTGVNADLMLDYWNVHTCQRIGTSLPLNYQFDNKRPLKSFMLSFSPNGKKILVRIPGKCIVMDVPFEVIHKPDANKEEATLIYWLLNNYKHPHHNEIPDDIITLLMHNLLELHKR